MNLQFYETMDDKSKEYLLYLIDQIQPQFTEGEMRIFLKDISAKPLERSKGAKSKMSSGYVEIGNDVGKSADLSKLNEEQLKIIFQVFISREKNDRLAIKWRFYQYLKYMLELNTKLIEVNLDPRPDHFIDFIIHTEDNQVFLALCNDILELNNYSKACKEVINYAKKENLLPDRVMFITSKSFRNIPLDTPIKIVSKEIKPELFVEWVEENRRFKREDLLLVNDSTLKLAGFNFGSTEDLLNYVYKYTTGGQISIFRQLEFFTEVSDDDPEVELIWKGIMLKQ